MRIALIASSLRLAGAEKQFVYLARTLVNAGVNVRVYYLGPGDHYQHVLARLGIPLRRLFYSGRPSIMLAQLIGELWRFKPDIVQASQFGDLIFAGPAGRLCNSLVFGGVRSDGFHELNACGYRSSFLLGLSHGLIANSHRAKENLLSKGVIPQKIAVLPNVIDLGDFDYQATLTPPEGIPGQRTIVTAVGSLHPCKRFDRFLDALSLARKTEPQIFGVIAGKDLGAKAALEQRAKASGLLPGNVVFLGECDRVAALLRASRLLVLCSDYEGFPNVILEGMAAGLPVITTPVGDAARIVKHGTTGYVVARDDIRSMADCIVGLTQNQELSVNFGQAARKSVEQEYSFASFAERLFSIFAHFGRQQRKMAIVRGLEDTVKERPSSGHDKAKPSGFDPVIPKEVQEGVRIAMS